VNVGTYFILAVVGERAAGAAIQRDLLRIFGEHFSVEVCSGPREAGDRLKVMSRIGRKVALMAISSPSGDKDGPEFVVDVLARPDYGRIHCVYFAPPEDMAVIAQKFDRSKAQVTVLPQKYEFAELESASRRLITDYFAKRETPDIVNFASVLDLKRLSEELLEVEEERRSYRLQLHDLQSGLLRSPWRNETEIVEELTGRLDSMLDLPSLRLEIPRGEALLKEGDPNSHLYLVEKGLMGLTKKSGSAEVGLGRFGPGMFVGILSFIEGEDAFATVRAIEDSTLVKISAKDLKRLISEDAGLTALVVNLLLRGVSARLRESTQLHYRVNELNIEISRERDDLKAAIARLEAAEMKLVEREKMALLGQFIAGIAHELNNPAGAMQRAGDQLAGSLIGLMKDIAAFKDGRMAEIRSEGWRVMSDALDKSPKALPAIRSEAKNYEKHLTGEPRARELARMLADMHVSESEAHEIASRPKADEAIRLLYRFHDIGIELRHIRLSAERVEGIVKSLRDYARPQQSEPVSFDVRTGIDDTLTIMSHTMKSVSVFKSYEDLPPITGQPAELNQVWTNLIVNAVEAMKGAGKLWIKTQRRGETEVSVSFENDGPAIPAEVIGRLFDLNFTTKKGGASFGLGIGLPISRNIVENHGGTITVESHPRSTTFTVVLPIKGEYRPSQRLRSANG